MSSALEYLLCRLCLCSGGCLADILEENNKLDFMVEKTIEDLLQIKVTKEPNYPWNVCSPCLQKLTDFRLFKEHCIECQFVFRNRIQKGNSPLAKDWTAWREEIPLQREENCLCIPVVDELNCASGDDLNDEPGDSKVHHGRQLEIAIKEEEVHLGSKGEEASEGGQELAKDTPGETDDSSVASDAFEVVAGEEGWVTAGTSSREGTLVEGHPNTPGHITSSFYCIDVVNSLKSDEGELSASGFQEQESKSGMRDVAKCSNVRLNVCSTEVVGNASTELFVADDKLEGQVFRCDICESEFSTKGLIVEHMKHHIIGLDLRVGRKCKPPETLTNKPSHSGQCRETVAINEAGDVHGSGGTLSCDVCGRKFISHSSLAKHGLSHKGKSPFACNHCNKRFTRLSILKKHMYSTHLGVKRGPSSGIGNTLGTTGKKPFPCSLCPKTFNEAFLLKRHVLRHMVKWPHSCTVCDKAFCDQYVLERHMISHEGEQRNPCGLCDKSFCDASTLQEHMLSHTGDGPHCCGMCHQRFALASALSKHMSIHSSERPHQCPLCPKAFRLSSMLKKHTFAHSKVKPYKCTLCSKSYCRKLTLNRHVEVNHVAEGERPQFSCNVCSKTFARKDVLSQHLIWHSGSKPHSCDTCSKAFTRRHSLLVHMAVHTGIKRFVCSVCSKAFVQNSELKRHMIVHTREKSHACSICQEVFTQKDHLRAHMKVHSGDKPYSCSLCPKVYALKSSLKYHLRTHAKETTHPCSMCSMTFTAKGALKKHTLSTHTENGPE